MPTANERPALIQAPIKTTCAQPLASWKKFMPTAKKKERRGATWSTVSPACSAHLWSVRAGTRVGEVRGQAGG